MNQGIQSLHSHTLLSDGNQTHFEVLETAEKNGFSVVAFTDHDALPDKKLIKKLKTKNFNIKWCFGIEISSGLPKELGGTSNGPHIIGLFIDPFNKELVEHCQKSQEQRILRMQYMVKGLNDLGFDITEKEALDNAKGGSVGQPHIVAALISHEENLKLIDKYREKMRKDGETNPEIDKKYKKMMDAGEYQYPYTLFLSSSAYLSVSATYNYWKDFDASVALIRNAGGIASLAHYTFSKEELPWDILEKILKEGRIDALETVYGLWQQGTDLATEITSDIQKLKALSKKYQKLQTGGADSHSEKDFADFAKTKASLDTKNMLEDILKKLSRKL